MKKMIAGIGIAVMSVLVLAGCAQNPEVITLTHAAGTSNSILVDANPDDVRGDYSVFDSHVFKDGEPYGSMVGSLTQVGSLGGGTNPEREERLVSAIFDLPEGQINVMGLSFYNPDATKMEKNEPYVRAIVGGTGAYAGARGEVSTVHNEDGTYTHTITLRK